MNNITGKLRLSTIFHIFFGLVTASVNSLLAQDAAMKIDSAVTALIER